MSDHSKIEWTDATWNPLVGCSRVSGGCTNCYAERHAYRFARQPGGIYFGTAKLVNGKPTFTGRINLNERVFDQPLRWKRPRRIFVNSMSDLFHENVSDDTLDRIFAVMSIATQHTFQVLTKRAERMHAYITADRMGYIEGRAKAMLRQLGSSAASLANATLMGTWPWPNVWLGVSVENQKAADERIPLLLRTPAAIRFLSCEPLIGRLDVSAHLTRRNDDGEVMTGLRGVDWVIAGGESGPHARPMHPGLARLLRDQCRTAGVPFFFKQWGEYLPGEVDFDGVRPTWQPYGEHQPDNTKMIFERERISVVDAFGVEFGRVGKKAAGRTLDDRTHDGFPRS